jgi:ATP-dependent DNA helicase Rep
MKQLQLNAEQLAAVHYIDGPLLVLAGAGSGKTSVITQKIAYLIQQCNIKPSNIVAVTFTNKAAQEMSKRVSKLLDGGKSIHGLTVSTFHRFGLKFIQTEHQQLGFKPSLSIFDNEDSLSLLRELILDQSEEHKEKLDLYLQLISRFKNASLDPTAALKAANNALELTAAKLYAQYQKQLKVYNAVDFDDLILLPLMALSTDHNLLEKWQNKIHYLLVDEYQDTNKSQYALIQLLTGVRGALTVVGDDHQSIYTWRGARADNLIQLQTDFTNLKMIKLEQNYRSTSIILRAANQLISQNKSLFPKNLWSQLGIGERIRVLYAADEEHEANRVILALLSHKFQNSTDFRDYAILYRSNHQSRVFEKSLREHRIPYQVSGGISFFSRTEVKDILAYLKILVNPDDDGAFLRIANVPKREIGPSTLEKLGNYAKQRNLSLLAASFELGLEQTLSGKPLDRLRNFTHWLVLTADNAIRGDTFAVIKDMIKSINYQGWLLDNASHPKMAELKTENVNDLLNWIKRLLENEQGETKTFVEAVQSIVLMDILEHNQDSKPSDSVQLMTLHAAKGLEFSHVFLAGVEEELLPHRTSIEENNIEEERRLAYVGITRAQQTLTLSLTRQRKKHNQLVDSKPSRFLEELPKDDLLWDEDKATQSVQKKEQEGRAHLSAMRGLLSSITPTVTG